MNENRLAGAAETLKGQAMAGLGHAFDDAELVRRGQHHTVAGKIRNVIGSIRDMLGIPASSRPTLDPDRVEKDAGPDIPRDISNVSRPATSQPATKDKIMNQDQFEGSVRTVKGVVEKGVGDITTDTKWQADGIVDQVAGKTQNLYGRAKEKVQDVIEDAPAVLADASDKLRDVAQQGRTVANEQMKQNPWVLAAAVGVVGYAVSWMIHGRKA